MIILQEEIDPYGEDEWACDEAHEGEGDRESGSGWEQLQEGDEGYDDDYDGLPEPVHMDDLKTVLLVARGGQAGVGNKMMMRNKGGREKGGPAQQLQSMV